MNLEEALREHLGCTHEIELVRREGYIGVVHGDKSVGQTFSEGEARDAARGSDLFHFIARHLIGVEGHTRTPMNITDEEYAGYCA